MSSQVLYRVDLCSKKGKKIKTLYKDITGSRLKKLRPDFRASVNNEKILKIYKKKNTKSGIKESLYDTIDLTVIKNIADALNYDYKYLVEVDYNVEYDCFNEGCDGICRCGKMVDVEIEDINVSYVVEKTIGRIIKKLKLFELNMPEEVFKYCLDRVLRPIMRVKSNYDVSYGPSYYGDEINGVYIYHTPTSALTILAKEYGLEAVKLILEQEYGFLTDFIEKAEELYVIEASKEELKAPNEEYCRKLNKELVGEYSSLDFKNFPIGIYREDGDFYRLIDDYHRYAAFVASGVKSCKILVLE